jgi:hypothetical protein
MRREPKRRLSEDQKRARRTRFFEERRMGFRAAEIAAREGLTPRRVRQIVREAQFERLLDSKTAAATPETEGLQLLLRRARRLVKTADSATIRALSKIVDRPDRLAPAARLAPASQP